MAYGGAFAGGWWMCSPGRAWSLRGGWVGTTTGCKGEAVSQVRMELREAHLATMVANKPGEVPCFPLLTLGISADKPSGRVAKKHHSMSWCPCPSGDTRAGSCCFAQSARCVLKC